MPVRHFVTVLLIGVCAYYDTRDLRHRAEAVGVDASSLDGWLSWLWIVAVMAVPILGVCLYLLFRHPLAAEVAAAERSDPRLIAASQFVFRNLYAGRPRRAIRRRLRDDGWSEGQLKIIYAAATERRKSSGGPGIATIPQMARATLLTGLLLAQVFVAGGLAVKASGQGAAEQSSTHGVVTSMEVD